MPKNLLLDQIEIIVDVTDDKIQEFKSLILNNFAGKLLQFKNVKRRAKHYNKKINFAYFSKYSS